MPPASQASSSSAAVPSAPAASSQSDSSGTTLALGISLAVLAFLVFGGLALYFLRRRTRAKKQHGRVADLSSHRRTYMVAVDPDHLAARVTPFGVGVNAPHVEVPKFVHNPGENMRVAYRRSDGGWSFQAQETPGPSFDLNRELTTSTRLGPSKEKKLHPGELTTRGYVESDVEGNPPPAYDHEGASVVSDCTGHRL
ncbi:uncharacterized protein BXZ73DRAFT_91017 [Epithele typhae]|uniref:uncharacterized protein n=1 Tax=Epithele typhae TaxID=378194 RepID=UPI002007481B|nr:uncharacterized protein BXZ73DRAFT_91017 [Epithele typhae]KAH9925893.1 hypothetical protein BXZ73DRAFT_91017 [Epithele typhae]